MATTGSLLVSHCEENSVKNVLFKERWVDIKYVPFILSNSSLNILNYMSNTIFRYGGSQGNLFNTRPVASLCSNLEMVMILSKVYNAGIIAESTTPEDYAKEYKCKIYNMNVKEYNNLCQNALDAAKEFDFDTVLSAKFTFDVS